MCTRTIQANTPSAREFVFKEHPPNTGGGKCSQVKVKVHFRSAGQGTIHSLGSQMGPLSFPIKFHGGVVPDSLRV
ncbi:hypothetical protein CEXT_642601 [Caerostris extrusa]|uniref:Uncharacterized protein n=1 Tax=Caerostris extrusa TaxID=172846 RepID=A0AAV4S0L6_CAEEX|nr:hypothetical protein CEXT_642601 [Caerostris extrusa]